MNLQNIFVFAVLIITIVLVDLALFSLYCAHVKRKSKRNIDTQRTIMTTKQSNVSQTLPLMAGDFDGDCESLFIIENQRYPKADSIQVCWKFLPPWGRQDLYIPSGDENYTMNFSDQDKEAEIKNGACSELLERGEYNELARHSRNKDIDSINQCMYTQGILSGAQIVEEIAKGNIVITDFDPRRLNPNSYNVRLANELLVYNLKPGECLDMKKNNPTKVIDLNDFPDGYVLQPGVLYLGSTMETAGCKHHLVPMLAGRSSIARLGMGSDYFAAFGDVGFGSKAGVKWTYEITVIHPLKIYAGVDIAQVYFLTLAGKELSNYNETGKYANNTGVEASKLYEDFENK